MAWYKKMGGIRVGKLAYRNFVEVPSSGKVFYFRMQSKNSETNEDRVWAESDS